MSWKTRALIAAIWMAVFTPFQPTGGIAVSEDLPEILDRGTLRHLGVPYANFVTGSGDGMDVELVKGFARELGVEYVFVESRWADIIADLTGQKVRLSGDNVETVGDAPVRGDLIANGFTVLPWRQKVVAFSSPTFPTQVWLVARADYDMRPITPSGDIDSDIGAVKQMLRGVSVLGISNTCLDPSLYHIGSLGAVEELFPGRLNELAPALIAGKADTTLLDVPDALIALEKWPGQIKVIGPVSAEQTMAVGFRKDAPELLNAYNRYLEKAKADGTYIRLVKNYYPAVFGYYPDFFIE